MESVLPCAGRPVLHGGGCAAKRDVFCPPRAELERERRENTTGWPRISICTALYNTDPRFLKEFLASFLAQSYENCELCLADASDSDHAYVRQIVADCRSDRIRYQKLDRNAVSARIPMLLHALRPVNIWPWQDHDDILSPNGCYELAKAASEGADFIYSDEALFSGDYLRPRTGHFQAGLFSLLSARLQTTSAISLPFWQSGFGRSGGCGQNLTAVRTHDLFFRLTEISKEIRHIPRVLYYLAGARGQHQRRRCGKNLMSTAAAKRAIDAHLERVGVAGKARDGLFPSTYRVDYEITGTPLVRF